jgi:hypothetical protein
MKLLFQFSIPLALVWLLGSPALSLADNDSLQSNKPTITISGFADVFYGYDINKPHQRRHNFLVSHNRSNQFGLNLGFIKTKVEQDWYELNFALQAGTYVDDNYRNESGLTRLMHEANIKVRLGSQQKFSIQAGIMPSHIGFESAVSMDCPTLTRSLVAENSPYYMGGAQLLYHPSEFTEFALVLMNGWQIIESSRNNSLALGTRMSIGNPERIKFNWSTFAGDVGFLRNPIRRYYSNHYAQMKLGQSLELMLGFDVGFQERRDNSKRYDYWFSPLAIASFTLNERIKLGLRGEYFYDYMNLILFNNSKYPMRIPGCSVNLDYWLTEKLLFRTEARYLRSINGEFSMISQNKSQNNFFFISSLAMKFGHRLR